MGLAEAILKDIFRRGEAPVLIAPHLRLGGAAMAQATQNIALNLQRKGLGQGSLLAVRSDDLLASLCLVLAAGLLGCRWTLAGTTAAGTPDLTLDTVPEGQSLLPSATQMDETWITAPMDGRTPPLSNPRPEDAPWLILPQGSPDAGAGIVSLSGRDLRGIFSANAMGSGIPVAGLGGPADPEQLLLCLSALFHGGVLVESADPADWLHEGVMVVAGRPETVAACLGQLPLPRPIAELWLWSDAPANLQSGLARSFGKVLRRQQVPEGPAGDAEAGPMLALLERLFCDVEGVADAACFMVPRPLQADRLTALVVLAPGADLPQVTSEAKLAALRLGGKAALPGRFHFAESLPRRPDGSVDREACRDQVLKLRAARRSKASAGG